MLLQHMMLLYLGTPNRWRVDLPRLCLILDLDGHFIAKRFHTRELGYYAYNRDHGRLAFEPGIPYKNPFIRDRRTVNFVNKKLLGLRYEPYQDEQAMQQEEDFIINFHLQKDQWLVTKEDMLKKKTL